MSFLFSDIFAETHQNRSDLSAGSVAFRLQCGAADTGNKTLFICPLHCSFCVGADLRGVGKTGQIVRSGGIVTFIGSIAIQYGCHLFPCDRIVRSEAAVIVAIYNIVGGCPADCFRVILVQFYICEGRSCGRRFSFQSVGER